MPTPRRKAIPPDVRLQVLHEAGFRCPVPACRTILTLDIHHMETVAEGGGNDPSNLLPLCPNCHALHHRGTIPSASIRAWKTLLISLNQGGLSQRDLDLLLALDKNPRLAVLGEGVLECASLIASNLVSVEDNWGKTAPNGMAWDRQWNGNGRMFAPYALCLTERGGTVVAAWKAGDEEGVVTGLTTKAQPARRKSTKGKQSAAKL